MSLGHHDQHYRTLDLSQMIGHFVDLPRIDGPTFENQLVDDSQCGKRLLTWNRGHVCWCTIVTLSTLQPIPLARSTVAEAGQQVWKKSLKIARYGEASGVDQHGLREASG
jgi:hypothetical protein